MDFYLQPVRGIEVAAAGRRRSAWEIFRGSGMLVAAVPIRLSQNGRTEIIPADTGDGLRRMFHPSHPAPRARADLFKPANLQDEDAATHNTLLRMYRARGNQDLPAWTRELKRDHRAGAAPSASRHGAFPDTCGPREGWFAPRTADHRSRGSRTGAEAFPAATPAAPRRSCPVRLRPADPAKPQREAKADLGRALSEARARLDL